jgi:hypothetical protein
MICKDAMRALIDVKGVVDDCTTYSGVDCLITTPVGHWNTLDTAGTAVTVDQSVSSGYTTVDAVTDYVDRVDLYSTGTTLKDLCDQIWTVDFTSDA